MSLSFLPENIRKGLAHLNENRLTEIRLRKGQPVIVGYDGEYRYLGSEGLCRNGKTALIAGEMASVLHAATDGCIYNFTEQMKGGFITVDHGVRIGIAGEYVTQNGVVNAVRNVTSLNIRIPHDIVGCSRFICERLFLRDIPGVLLFAKPGLGKTTMLRDIARFLGSERSLNVLVFDERGEIAAMDGYGNGFDLGDRVDVVRCSDKSGAIASAIRAMKPDVIITDELYGKADVEAVRYAVECGLGVIASSHTVERNQLKLLPFEFFVELKKLGGRPEIYDKNFNPYFHSCIDNIDRSIFVGE